MKQYATPSAYRMALTQQLRQAAKDSPWPMAQLQRQVAYDHFLRRLYARDGTWIVKGSTALLARGIGVRATMDIDLYRNSTLAQADEEIRAAAAASRAAGEWFDFGIGGTASIAAGRRLPITASIGPAEWARFHVDLVSGDALTMTGTPEAIGPIAQVELAYTAEYQAYPIPDHIADKIAATHELYSGHASTRFKDLVDLIAITAALTVDAAEQMTALHSEFTRRGLTLPDRFTVPDRALWEPGYAKEAARAISPLPATLDEAIATIRPFTDPLFAGTAAGTWNPVLQAWQARSPATG